MTSPILDSTFNFDNRSQRWRDSSNGQYISSGRVVEEMRVHQRATYATLESLTNRLYSTGSDRISLSEWQIASAMEIKNAHLAQAMFGAGGRDNMTFANYGRVGNTLRYQYGFLNGFAEDIANGRVSQAQALARIRQYGNASQQSYWSEFAQTNKEKAIYYRLNPAEHCSDCIDREAGNPYTFATLRGYPGDGSTKCKANDMCTMEVIE